MSVSFHCYQQLVDAPQLHYQASAPFDSYDASSTLDESDAHSPHHNIGEASPSGTNASLTAEDATVQPTPSSRASHAGSDGWHSLRSNPISEEWQSHFSPRTNPLLSGEEEEEGSDTWTQLDDSRSASPSWSITDVTRGSR